MGSCCENLQERQAGRSLMAASRSPSSDSELGHCEVPLSLFLNLNGHYSRFVSLAALTEIVLCCICLWAWEWKINSYKMLFMCILLKGIKAFHISYTRTKLILWPPCCKMSGWETNFIIRSPVEEAASTFLHPTKPKIIAIVNLTH